MNALTLARDVVGIALVAFAGGSILTQLGLLAAGAVVRLTRRAR